MDNIMFLKYAKCQAKQNYLFYSELEEEKAQNDNFTLLNGQSLHSK